jgi:hypothetical protein
MAIGTSAAIIGSAVIGAGAGILGNKAQNKAAGQAADASAAAAQAQLQLGRESLAFNRDIYNSNYGMLSPYVSRGNVAGNQINALLGLPNAPAMTSPLAAAPGTPYGGGSSASGGALDPAWAAQALQSVIGDLSGSTNPDRGYKVAYNNYLSSNPIKYLANGQIDPTWAAGAMKAVMPAIQSTSQTDPDRDISQTWSNFIGSNPIKYAAAPATPATGGGGTGGGGNAGTTAQSAQNAFEQFANSAGMQFQLDTAHDAINNGYAGSGALQSGAAMKEISDRSQDIALNNYFLPYMGLLGGQQGAGLQAGGAIAGVGVNAANTNANISGQMGGAIGQNAANIGNLALAQGQNKANMWAGLGSSFGDILGGMK